MYSITKKQEIFFVKTGIEISTNEVYNENNKASFVDFENLWRGVGMTPLKR